MSSLCVSFNDTVRLKDSRIGRVRFIGRTTVKKMIFYGIHLKQNNGDNDGSMHNRRYFKCPPNHGVFVKKSYITEIIKIHTLSASFHYNQHVMVTNIGIGIVKYIGMTDFGNAYWFGIELENKLQSIDLDHLSNNNNIHPLSNSKINNFHYFDSDENRSIFVRGNQIKSARNTEFRRKEIHFKEKPISPPHRIRYKMEEKEEKEDDPYTKYINKTLISMMDSLNIPINKRAEIFSMDNTNKLLLIQQWFITPNTKQLQKTMNKNIKQRKKSQSLILLNKNKKNKNDTPITPNSPIQSSSDNVNFDGCDLSKKNKKNKMKKSVKKKRKKSKSVIVINRSKNKKNITSKTKRNKELKKSAKILKANNTKKQKSSKLSVNYLKPKNIKNKNINKSKSASLLIKKSKLENVKKTKCIKSKSKKNIKPYNYTKTKRKESKSAILLIKKSEVKNIKKKKRISKNSNKKHIKINKNRKESKSAVLLIKKSEFKNIKKKKRISKNSNKKHTKINKNRNRKESKSAVLLIKKSEKYKLKKNAKLTIPNKKYKYKSRKLGSAQLLTMVGKGNKRNNNKKCASSKKVKTKKTKRKNRHIVDKLID